MANQISVDITNLDIVSFKESVTRVTLMKSVTFHPVKYPSADQDIPICVLILETMESANSEIGVPISTKEKELINVNPSTRSYMRKLLNLRK